MPGAYVPYGLVGRTFENLGGGVQVPRHSGVHPGDHLIVVEHLFSEHCLRKKFLHPPLLCPESEGDGELQLAELQL